MKSDVYQIVTDKIIRLLEAGAVPWHKAWTVKTCLPRNLVTQKPYRGVNAFLLVAMSYESPHWLTFRQANQLGGSIKKGEKACPVVFWKRLEIERQTADEPKRIPLLRLYHVFNVSQCDGLKAIPEEVPLTPTKPAEIVATMPQPPAIQHGMTHAYYSPFEDTVGLPARERFDGEPNYYATLFHELIHSTGHEKRLNRAIISEQNGFGSDPYCKEEMIAELGSAFLCGFADIVDRTIDNSAAYLQGWLKRLQSDRTLIVHAAAQAQKACDFIRRVEHAPEGGGD